MTCHLKRLSSLALCLDEDDISAIKFVLEGRNLESVSSAEQLLHRFVDLRLIRDGDDVFLKEVLAAIGRTDLVDKRFRGDPAVLTELSDGAAAEAAAEAAADAAETESVDSDSDVYADATDDDVRQLFLDVGPSSVVDETKHDFILQHLHMDFEEPLRKYQRSLAVPGIRGDNSIIALKTGAGKTRIAAYIAKFHKVRSLYSRSIFKAVFVVPIRTLTEQQKKVFQLAFPPSNFGPSRVAACEDTGEFLEKFQNNDVVLCTAQVLVNNLRRSKIAMEDLSLLMLDECHHTTKKHPYEYIMRYYKDLKYNRSPGNPESRCYRPKGGRVPQILGLSASLGADSKKLDIAQATEDAYSHLIKICVNLDAAVVMFPESVEDVKSLDEFSPETKNDIVVHVEKRPHSPFQDILTSMAGAVARAPESPVDASALTSPKSDVHYPAVFNDLVAAEQHLAEAGLIEEKVAVSYLKLLCRCVEHLSLMRAQDVLKFLTLSLTDPDSEWLLFPSEILSDIAESDATEGRTKREVRRQWMKNQVKLLTLAEEEKLEAIPILFRLEKLLLELFTNPNAKGIVLSRTRFSTEALMDFVETSPALKEIVRPCRLVGHSEMTDSSDQEVLEQFRNGSKNLLVATDIAQEGLDIPSCNFVIRYSFVSNEIGDVQAKGRARMRNAKRYSLIIRESIEDKLEKKNAVLVKAMTKALKLYSKEDKDAWAKKVEREQKETYLNTKREEQIRETGKTDPELFRLVCKMCQHHLVDAKDIVHVNNNHYVVDGFEEKYGDRMFVVPIPEGDPSKLSFKTEDYIGLTFCTNCQTKVGTQIFIKVPCQFSGPNVVLAKDHIRYQPLNGPVCTQKFQWTKVPFRIRKEEFLSDLDSVVAPDPLEFFKDVD